MGLSLYEVTGQISDLENSITAYAAEHEGLIPDDLDAQLEALQGERNDKLLSLGRWIKNMEAEAAAIATEKKSLAARQSALEKRAERIRAYVAMNLPAGEKLSDICVAYSWRKSTSTEIFDENAVPDDYCAIIRKPSATEIKAAILAGETIPGARLLDKLNLQIR